ncbi:MAG TPA: ThiF family adenylyltransferase [Actinomycetota bacterium]|nr:ThiF family adenylyltransferase [Actinomycetota bacterium]
MHKPRIKSVFPPIPVGGGVIRIGGSDHGLAAEIQDDEQGHVMTALSLVDGSRTTAEVVEAMLASDPELTPSDVNGLLDDLAANGYLEDAAVSPPAELTDQELERYRRNLDFFNYFAVQPVTSYDYQLRLKNSRVTVLGLGGLGSYVALSLAAAGVGDLLLVDDDVVEPSNLNRQVLYTGRDIGRRKTDAAEERLREVNPHINVTALNFRVSDTKDAEACMTGRDLLVCAADRPRIRIYRWLNEAAIRTLTPWVRGANDGLTVRMFLHAPGRTACFECGQARAHRELAWYGAAQRYAMEVIGDRTVNPCTSPVAGLIGNLVALEVVKYLTGVEVPASLGHGLSFDLRSLTISRTEGERQPECPACSSLFALAGAPR